MPGAREAQHEVGGARRFAGRVRRSLRRPPMKAVERDHAIIVVPAFARRAMTNLESRRATAAFTAAWKRTGWSQKSCPIAGAEASISERPNRRNFIKSPARWARLDAKASACCTVQANDARAGALAAERERCREPSFSRWAPRRCWPLRRWRMTAPDLAAASWLASCIRCRGSITCWRWSRWACGARFSAGPCCTSCR